MEFRRGVPMLHTAALLCLTLMTGNEICVAAFINPVLRALPEREQVPFLARSASQLGLAMPFWYITSLLLTVADLLTQHHAAGLWKTGPLVALGVQLVVMVLTVGFMVPINNRLGRLTPSDTGWTPDANRWDSMHRVRVLLLLVAVVALAAL